MERGYERATIRGIAAGAGVDPALVHHYFGSKDQLLLTALQPAALEAMPQLIAAGTDGLGERVIRATFEVYEGIHPSGWAMLVGLVRSATTHEEAARMLRDAMGSGGLFMLVEALGLPQPRLRVALVASELVGLAMARFVIGIEPIASADVDAIVDWYAPTFQRYLTAPLAGDDPGGGPA